jgi:hypothetical protein
MTGNAQLVAQEIELRLRRRDDVIIDTALMDSLDAGVFGGGVFLICVDRGTATCRQRQALYASLLARRGSSGVRYGVFALGIARTSEHSAMAPPLRRGIAAAGAQRIGDVARHDARRQPPPRTPRSSGSRGGSSTRQRVAQA